MLIHIDFEKTTSFRCPIFLFIGRHDYTTSRALEETWFHTIRAPQKEIIQFNDAAHMVMQKEPGRFLQHLVNDVRPLAVKAGDAAPDDVITR